MGQQAERKLVIDATVEQSTDGGKTWHPYAVPSDISGSDRGPWSIPHATEIGRSLWANWVCVGVQPPPKPDVRQSFRNKLMAGHLVRVRVVDVTGKPVEQWPKTVT
jgi:hypothetical protein